MVYTVGKYVQSIAMVIIFTTFVNLIMPSGAFEKYIKMVLGLIIIITILVPINKLIFINRPSYTDFLKKYEIDIENTVMKSQNSNYLEAQKDIILDSYKEKLIPQMTENIQKSNKVSVLQLEIELNQDTQSQEFGKITDIHMIVEPIQKELSTKKIKVPKIRVGTKQIKSYTLGENKDGVAEKIEKNIKTSLIDFYNLTDVNINITVQKNS